MVALRSVYFGCATNNRNFFYLQINYRIHWKRGITFYFGFVGCWSALALPLAVRHLRKRLRLLLPHPSFPSSHHYPRQTTMPRTSCGLCRHLCRRRWSTATPPTRSPDRRTWKVWTSTSSAANLKLHVNCGVLYFKNEYGTLFRVRIRCSRKNLVLTDLSSCIFIPFVMSLDVKCALFEKFDKIAV